MLPLRPLLQRTTPAATTWWPWASRNQVYFGRHADGKLESEFSGNLVEVCPTGVFTDKTFKRHYTRKWDLQTAPSVCVALRPGLQHHPGRALRHCCAASAAATTAPSTATSSATGAASATSS